jgi:hypothetical protein
LAHGMKRARNEYRWIRVVIFMNKREPVGLFSNLCLLLIIGLVSLGTFGAHLLLDESQPALKGRTGEDAVGLQIAVAAFTDLGAYMDALEQMGVRGTFFFHPADASSDALAAEAGRRGHGVGYYGAADDGAAVGLYIGGGYSVPVMSCEEGGALKQVCPSINVTRLQRLDDWPGVLSARLAGDMFLYIDGDNDCAGLKKIVQIVLDKGYTIMKVDEML